MGSRAFFFALMVWLSALSSAAPAALIIDAPRPITHRVQVQIIETALTDGTSPATVFGNATQRAGIETGVNRIWAQAGINVEFLPIVRYNNTFAYQGNGGSRPTSDLNQIITAAQAVGAVHSDPSVINMFFVKVVPGFAFTSENTANGLANIAANGAAQFVGKNLLTFQNGRDVIASVVAHEIGHNLGLKHTASGLPNLMSPSGTSQQLSAAQFEAVFQTARRNDSVAYIPSGGLAFLQPLPSDYSLLAGDYNGDGVVNAADYTLWRDRLGSMVNLAADGNGNGAIDAGDYTVWKSNFGMAAAASHLIAIDAVPEPATWLPLAIVLAGLLTHRPRRFTCKARPAE